MEAIEKKSEDKSDPPKNTKTFSIMRWSKVITDHLKLKIGLRKTPLSHAVRESVEVDHVSPTRRMQTKFSE